MLKMFEICFCDIRILSWPVKLVSILFSLCSVAYGALFYCCEQKVMFDIQNMARRAGSSYLDLPTDGIGLLIAAVGLNQQ